MTWLESALHDLMNTQLSYATIAKKYGRTPQAIGQLAAQHNIVRVAKRGQQPMDTRKSISKYHVALGLKISLARGSESYTTFGEQLGVSRYVVKTMELGLHDFTLTELLKLSNIMGQDINTLIETYDGR